MIEFRMIPGFEPYEISSCGKLRLNGKMLTTPSMKNGYKRKYLKTLKRNLLIHRAIALAFISNPDGLSEINHIDGNKANNDLSNLEWVNRQQNAKHAYLSGLMHDQRGDRSHRAKLTTKQVVVIREALQNKHSQKSIAKYFRLNQSTISLIKNRVNWTAI